MTAALTNEETGLIDPMILSINTQIPHIKYFHIKSEIPNRVSTTKRVKLIVCGQETISLKGRRNRKIKTKSKKKWVYFNFNNYFRFSQSSKSACPIVQYKLCTNAKCTMTNYDKKKFSIKKRFGVNLRNGMTNEIIYLQAITRGLVK